jgi:uncharacterized protein (DUF934 family)
MALIKDDRLAEDPYQAVAEGQAVPEAGAVLVTLTRWEGERQALIGRDDDVGVFLRSDESPERIADDLERISLVALEFPRFRDGRAYTWARMLRERFGFAGEVRAVGDVLMEQLHFMLRTGFNAFEFESSNPLEEYELARAEFSVWYQPTGDGRPTAIQLRHPAAR